MGKTTRSIGLAVRAAAENINIEFIQFMKSGSSGEVGSLGNIPNIRYRCPGKHPFIMSRGPEAVHFKHAKTAYRFALEAIENGAQLLICDEILDTLVFDLLTKMQLLDLMNRCRGKVELVMTGMHAPLDLIKVADYATEFHQVKHPYYKGVRARKGIEY
ncbi:MAG: cob(I)yrinic acid a,c-diamide adenosyltransferase [Desulfobacterales bacterium]|nr:cob(I)yrinic acid a,c-diamide adenosyltransferase [Desulfobacterales bacterium]